MGKAIQANVSLTEARLSSAANKLAKGHNKKAVKKYNNSSRLEDAIFRHLPKEFGLTPERLPNGITADYVGTHNGKKFVLEVDGPAHFLVYPRNREAGRLPFKRRLIEHTGYKFISLPYHKADSEWFVGADGRTMDRDKNYPEVKLRLTKFVLDQLQS